jgi:hypothetical protein
MGVHWAAGLTYWKAHVARDGTTYDLSHLDPLRFEVSFDEYKGLPARVIAVHVGFALHTFTIDEDQAGADSDLFDTDRERRVFDRERYELSKRLRQVLLDLPKSKCFFTSGISFLTVRGDAVPAGFEYRVFFTVRRRAKDAVELIVQSAYLGRIDLAPRGRTKQPVGFRVILINTCDGRPVKRPA